MKGFFEKEKTTHRKKQNIRKISGCESCGAYKDCRNGKLGVVGNGDKEILIVGGMVSNRDDREGMLLIDVKGKFLKYALSQINIDLDRDCWYIPAIQCNSSVKNAPTASMINSCKHRLKKEVERLNPKKIVTLGSVPLETLIGDRCVGRMSLKPTEKLYGAEIPDQEIKSMVLPNYDMGFVLSPLIKRYNQMKDWGKLNKRYKDFALWEHPQLKEYDDFVIKQKFFMKYLKNLLSKREFEKDILEEQCCVVTNVEEATSVLGGIYKDKQIQSFDYEATGKKLHKKGHKITCVSFSNGTISYAFPIFYEDKRFMRMLRRVLQDEEIGLISHNMAYEYMASNTVLGYETKGFVWDTMLGAHILDNRSNITGLKIQTYMMFGILGYDELADSYIKATKEDESVYGSNAFNRMNEMNIEDQCLYCAKDSHFTYHLYKYQKKAIESDPHLKKGFKLFHEGMLAFCKMMSNGFDVDEVKLIENENKLEEMIVDLEYKIRTCDEVKKWKKIKETDLNYGSSKQLSEFLFDILKLPKTKRLGEQYSTEAKELKDIAHLSPFLQNYLQIAKLKKIKDTDLKGIRKETVHGRIYPSFSLNIPKSFRSSSQAPNFQNHSIHDKFASEMVRSPLVVGKGRRIIGCDAASLEVGIGVSTHHDPTMKKQLEEGLDMHLGLAEKLFDGDLDDVADKIITIKKEMGIFDEKHDTHDEVWADSRYIGKNGLSFSLQFGDIYLSIGPTVWNKHLKDYHKEYFKRLGITTEDQFTEHIRGVCDWYWEENYGVFGQWRKDNWKRYVRTMKTKLATGFYSTTVMSRNQANNYVIQGPGFHCILYSQTMIQKYIDEHNLSSRIVAQIHDAVYIDTPEDLSEWVEGGLREVVVYYMSGFLMDEFKWIIHTMKADIDYYDNGNWYDHVKEEELLKRYGLDKKGYEKSERCIRELKIA